MTSATHHEIRRRRALALRAMPACQAWGCSNRNDRGKDIPGHGKTYFQFPNPQKNKKLSQRWLHNIGTGWTTKSFKFGRHKVVCEDHFEAECFVDDLKSRVLGVEPQRRLKADAVPSLFIHKKRQSHERGDRLIERKRKRVVSSGIFHQQSAATTTRKKSKCNSMDQNKKKKQLVNKPEDIEVFSVSIGVQTEEWCSDCGHTTHHRCSGPEASTSKITLDHSYSSPSNQEEVPNITPEEDELHINNVVVDSQSYESEFDNSNALSESFSSHVSSTLSETSLYEPSTDEESQSEDGESEFNHIENVLSQDKYIVFSDSLDEILYRIPCKHCSCPVDEIKKSFFGSMLTAKLFCTGGHEVLFWRSQPLLNDHVSAGNVMLCASVLFTGQTYKHVADVASLMNLKFVGKSTFYDTQIDYLLPVIEDFWKAEQSSVLSSLQDSTVQVSGDGRCDSPGYSARYCNYTMMDHTSLKIIDFEVVEVTEAKSSAGMEKIGFERVLDRLVGCTESESGMHVEVSDVSTDRHVSVRKLMKEKYAPMNINHQFDAYDMANSLRKKLKDKCRYKKFSALAPWVQSISNHLFWCASSCMGDADLLVAKWESLRYHIVNIHHWDGPGMINSCCHDVLTADQVARKKWLKQNSPAHRVLEEIMLNRRFLEDIRRLSKFLHTGRLEVYHSLLNKYCPKRQDFDKKQMTGRTQLAALDHNRHTFVEKTEAISPSHEESSSSDIVTFINPDGVRVAYSKHCSDWVLKPISELKSYSYLKDMIIEVLKRRKNQEKGVVKAKAKAKNIAKKPKPSKEVLLMRHISRLKKC